jgi:hypothetical protein
MSSRGERRDQRDLANIRAPDHPREAVAPRVARLQHFVPILKVPGQNAKTPLFCHTPNGRTVGIHRMQRVRRVTLFAAF